MKKNAVKTWIIVSFAVFALGLAAQLFIPDPFIPGLLRGIGWISSLVAVGYYVTSPSTTLGKVSFVGVIVMIFGIVFKILHWTGADEMIYVGLVALSVPFAIGFFRKKAQRESESSNK
jgi:voltage-gated potassium channel Kch